MAVLTPLFGVKPSCRFVAPSLIKNWMNKQGATVLYVLKSMLNSRADRESPFLHVNILQHFILRG